MKKTSNLFRNLLLSAAAMVGISSCSDSVIEGITEVQEGSSNARKVSITVEDFVPGDEQTRTSISKVGDDYRFAWSEGDQIGIWAVERTDGTECNGAFNYHTVNGGAGTNKVSFDGGDWGLRSDTKYYAFYPMPEGNPYGINNQRDRRALNYWAQEIDQANPMAHLAKYDYLASPVQTIEEDGSINFEFKHLGSLAIFNFQFPFEVDNIIDFTLTCKVKSKKLPYMSFVDSHSNHFDGNYGGKNESDIVIRAKSRLSTDNDGRVTLYAMLPPDDMSGANLEITVYTSEEGHYFKTITEGKNLQAGKAYNFDCSFEGYFSSARLIPTAELRQQIETFVNGNSYQQHGIGDIGSIIFLTNSLEKDLINLSEQNNSSVGADPNNPIYLHYNYSKRTLYFVTGASEIKPDNDCTSFFAGYTYHPNFQYLDKFYTADVENMSYMFDGLESLQQILEFATLDVSNVTDMSYMFRNTDIFLGKISISNMNAESLQNAKGMFQGCIASEIDLSGLITSGQLNNTMLMFAGCSNLQKLDLSGLHTENVVSMASMFQHCTRLTSLDLSSFDTSNVTDMSGMFIGCEGIDLRLDNFTANNMLKVISMFPSSGEKFTIHLTREFYDYLYNNSSSNVSYHNIDLVDY